MCGICCSRRYNRRNYQRKIGKPIRLCAERIEKLSEGDLTSPVPMVKSHDEVKILAKSAAKVVNEQNAMISDIGNILSNMAQATLMYTAMMPTIHTAAITRCLSSL